MKLLQRALNDKSAALALYLIAQKAVNTAGIVPGAKIAATCADYGISRQKVYEEKSRIEAVLTASSVAPRGRPMRQGASKDPGDCQSGRSLVECKLRIAILEFRLGNPGAVVIKASGRATYSDGFRRFILNAADGFVGTDEDFCNAGGVPYSTLMTWRQLDAKVPIDAQLAPRPSVVWPAHMNPNELARTIVMDFERWTGKVGDFLGDAARRFSVAPSAIKNVLRIARMLAVNTGKSPRYRGTTLHASPGAIAVTDGKEVTVELTASGERRIYNWQGIVDQATACHLAVVVSKTEDAKAVGDAYSAACEFLGKPPLALVHDQKPIHDDAGLRALVEKATTMIPATLGRGQNKAVIEGEFGKLARDFGNIKLDDTSKETLIASATQEIIRGYTTGINHAARKELDGKSRVEVVRQACPDPKKDADLIATIKAGHQRGRHPAKPLPTAPIARSILDEAFERFHLFDNDLNGRLRDWLAGTFEPNAIKRALAIFEAKKAKGQLKTKHAHRYLVKLISSMQIEIDLEREEHALLHYAQTEQHAWLAALAAAKQEIERDTETAAERIFIFAEHALFGGIFLEKAYWEKELTTALAAIPELIGKVTAHISRIYEAPELCRRRLVNRLIAAHFGFDHRIG